MFATVRHESWEFQIRNVPKCRLLDGQDCRGAFACVIKSQEFVVENFDVSRRLPIDIDCNKLPCNRSAIRCKSEHSTHPSACQWLGEGLAELCVLIPAVTSGLIVHPSLARPSPSGVYFCSHGASHTKKFI